MRYLKQSTTVTVVMGPALDKTDGVTEETGLSPTVYLSKNGGAQAARNSATAITHDALGYYLVELDGTDTGTLGHLRALFHDSGTHAPVWEDFVVLPANVWDSLIAGTDLLDANASQLGGTAQTGRDVGASVLVGDKTGFSLAAASIAAATFDTGALDAAALAANAVQEIVDGIMAEVVETAGSYTVQQVLSIVLAVLAGVTAASGATIKTPDGTATRVAATINASSERTAMTLTPSA